MLSCPPLSHLHYKLCKLNIEPLDYNLCMTTHIDNTFAYRERVDKCVISIREKTPPARVAVLYV